MQELTLVIGNKNYSSWSLRAWIWLKTNNLDFIEKQVLLAQSDTKANLANFNSNYKVPILLDENLQIWDSIAIAEYVSAKFLQKTGYPQDYQQQALARSFVAEIHSGFFNIRKELPMNCRKIDNPTKIQISEKANAEIERMQKILIQALDLTKNLQNSWLFGEEYSIADAFFAPFAIRFLGYGVELDDKIKPYIEKLIKEKNMQLWLADAKAETAVIG